MPCTFSGYANTKAATNLLFFRKRLKKRTIAGKRQHKSCAHTVPKQTRHVRHMKVQYATSITTRRGQQTITLLQKKGHSGGGQRQESTVDQQVESLPHQGILVLPKCTLRLLRRQIRLCRRCQATAPSLLSRSQRGLGNQRSKNTPNRKHTKKNKTAMGKKHDNLSSGCEITPKEITRNQ